MTTHSRAWQRYLLPVLAATATMAFQGAAWASAKKGVGISDFHDPQRVEALRVSWYYDWRFDPIEGVHLPFVATAPRDPGVPLNGKRSVVFGFSEPDDGLPGSLSVAQAVARWPELQQHAMRLGSPAQAKPDDGWLDQFMAAAARQHLQVDFITLHLYGPPDPAWFLKRIDEMHAKYHKPIWVTEFAVADWTAHQPGTNRFSEAQVLDCMRRLLPELEKRPYVERYAWYGAGKLTQVEEQVRTARLFDSNGSLTELGRYYSQF